MPLEQHYTPDEVAARLKISVSTVLRHCAAGRLRSVVADGGRARRIPESAIDDWLNGKTEEPTVGEVVSIEGRR